MSHWLLVAPERDDDEELARSAWIAQKTTDVVAPQPTELRGQAATRQALAHQLQSNRPSGVAFFGHGAADRLFGADRAPGDPTGPAILDRANIGMLSGCWVHAFACLSGAQLAAHAAAQGVPCYVGYDQRLDVGWPILDFAEAEIVAMVTCTTRELLAGQRDPKALRRSASAAADALFIALADMPNEQCPMFLYKLGQDLVDAMIVCKA